MIEHSLLMRLAREYADRQIRARPTLRAIVLAGSVARGEPPLGEAIDLDVLLIDDYPPEPPADTARLSEFVFVDAVYLRADSLADRRSLRANHFLAPAINEAIILHDPRHYFDILQASIRAPYNKPDNIHARARSALAAAQRIADRFAMWRDDPPPGAPGRDDLDDLRQALYLVAQAIILLSGQPGDSVGPRKVMVRFEAAARQRNADLYPLFLQALGVERIAPAEYESLLASWVNAYRAASQPLPPHSLIHPARRGYYERGFRALAAEGHAINTLWLLEHTLAECALSQPTLEAWQNYLSISAKADTAGFGARTRALEQLVALADETIAAWARSENVEW